MKIVVGSESAHKLAAVSRAAAKFFGVRMGMLSVEGLKTASAVNEQPVGIDEAYEGAFNRAYAVREMHQDAFCVGIESGIVRVADRTFDLGVIVLVTPTGEECSSISRGIRFPEVCVEMAASRGFAKQTAGGVIAEAYGLDDATDPHSHLTGGRISRADLIEEAVYLAFAQMQMS